MSPISLSVPPTRCSSRCPSIVCVSISCRSSGVSLPGYRDDLVRDRDLADVVQQGGELRLLPRPWRDAHLVADRGREVDDVAAVGAGVGVVRLDHVAQQQGGAAVGGRQLEHVRDARRALAREHLQMRVAINLSAHQLRHFDLVDRIDMALRRNEIRPQLLTCEITESVAMEDASNAIRMVERLSALGVNISIDDFGTGYSSLSYLRKLRAAELKIDRSFVLDLETSADARAVVDGIVKLAHALGLKVVAEGSSRKRSIRSCAPSAATSCRASSSPGR